MEESNGARQSAAGLGPAALRRAARRYWPLRELI